MASPFVLQRPFIYSLELTPACNNRCPGCGNVFDRQPSALSAKEWGFILDVLSPYASTLKITGGEPTLHPEFSAILHAIDRIGIPFTLFTNARWKKPKAIIALLAQMKNLGGILISLHGADELSHKSFVGVSGAFDETCKNIRQATESGLRVHTSVVLNKYNLHQLNAVVELSRSLGVKRVVFNRFLGPDDFLCQPSQTELKEAVKQIEYLRKKYPLSDTNTFSVRYGNCIPQCFIESGSSGCLAGAAYCTIDPWGGLRPCNHSPTVVGNLFDQSLGTLWQSEVMQSWRTLIPQTCITCGAYEQCRGGCRALIEIQNARYDPLMSSVLPTNLKTYEIELFRDAKPILDCEILPAQPGWVLKRGLSVFPISQEALSILHALNGKTKLIDLQRLYGQEALNFVGELIRRRYVSL